MKDFSLFYGPARGWLSAFSFAVVALLVVLAYQSRYGDPSCSTVGLATSAVGSCDGGLSGDADPTANGAEIEPFSLVSSPSAVGAATEGWERLETGPRGGDVPFVSLRPSPEPMTDAGRELVRQTERADS